VFCAHFSPRSGTLTLKTPPEKEKLKSRRCFAPIFRREAAPGWHTKLEFAGASPDFIKLFTEPGNEPQQFPFGCFLLYSYAPVLTASLELSIHI